MLDKFDNNQLPRKKMESTSFSSYVIRKATAARNNKHARPKEYQAEDLVATGRHSREECQGHEAR